MKTKLIMAAALAMSIHTALAQEITAYDADSTAYYNALHNPNDYAQAPVKGQQRKVLEPSRVHTSINMGTGFSSLGSYEFISPTVTYEASKKWNLNFGMGIAYSNWKPARIGSDENCTYDNLRALTTYYSAGAEYRASDKLSLYGDILYYKTTPTSHTSLGDNDGYMATFGATYNITKSLSVGFEVRSSRNVNPYGLYHNPYSPW